MWNLDGNAHARINCSMTIRWKFGRASSLHSFQCYNLILNVFHMPSLHWDDGRHQTCWTEFASDVRNPRLGSTRKVHWDHHSESWVESWKRKHTWFIMIPTLPFMLLGTPNHPSEQADSFYSTQELCRTVKFGGRNVGAQGFLRKPSTNSFKTHSMDHTAPVRWHSLLGSFVFSHQHFELWTVRSISVDD